MKTLTRISRSITTRIFSAILILGISLPGLAQMMSGIYTITGTSDFGGREFESFTEAVDSLASQGVSAAVIINAKAATYDENFVIPEIGGASVTNTITFQSETGDSNGVTIQHSGFDTSNHIVYFNGASHIIFQNITLRSTLSNHSVNCRIIYLDNQSNNITIRNNLFYSKASWDYYEERGAIIASYNEGIHDIHIDNNLFDKGETAISIGGSDGSGKLTGIQVTNNTVINQRERCMSFSWQIGTLVSGNNIVQTANQDRGGISMTNVEQGLQITGNKIDMIQPGISENPIWLRSCTGAPDGLIANNMVRVNLQDGPSRGIHLEDCKDQNIYHNSVRVRGSQQSDSRGLYIHGGSSENIDVQNNIIQNAAFGYTIYITSSAYISTIGNNNYFANSNLFARWGGTNYTHLEPLVAVTGETGSLSVPPAFEADDNLYARSTWLDDAGADLFTAVGEDIDGVTRSVAPSIGANEFAGAGSPLAGNYTVGGSSPDYATLDEATESLGILGVSAPVTFNLRDAAPFNERLFVYTWGGASNDNRVTFQSDPANSNNAIITYSGTYTGDQTLAFNSASFVTLKNLTLVAENTTNGTVIDFIGYCSQDSIICCLINGVGRSGSDNVIESKDDVLEDIHFIGNTINNGYRGIYLDGFDTRYGQNLSFTGNTFNDQYYAGIWLQHVRKPGISGNYIITSSGASTSYCGIYLNIVPDDFNILGNEIINNSGKNNGIYINTCTASQSYPSLVANNFVTAAGANTDVTGIRTNATNWCNIYHNTVNIQASNSSIESEAYANSGGTHINLLNNIFANFGAGRAITNTTPSAYDLSDFNCLFAAKKILVQWNGDHGRLTDHQGRNATVDQNSISVNPTFLSSIDLHVNSPFVDNKGNTGSTGITTDFDGETRSSPPDIGADEFTATRTPIPSGIYSVGASGDYTTINEAMDSLQKRGIAGPVTFQLKTGQFNEYIGRVDAIPGASDTDTIVIESESGNPEDVLIYYSTSSSEKSIITFLGVDNMTFRNLSVSATGASEGRPIAFGGFTENLSVVNNRFSSANTVSTNFLFYESITDNVLIKNNTITGGHYGISFSGDQDRNMTNTMVIGNTITEPYNTGILMKYHYAPKVINNVIYNKERSSFEGIQMEYCIEDLVVSGNRVNSNGSQYGIYLNHCKATNPFYGLISNNSVHIGGTSSYAWGLYLNNCERMNLYHNSSHISGTSTSNGLAIYIRDANLHINVKNNVASNSGGGYAYCVNDGNDIDASDFNNFYATGTNMARWGGTYYSDLTALKTASSKDANSISWDPLFITNSDLRSQQPQLHEKGTPIEDVPYDIDSVLRDAAKPDPGAYEFTCVAPTFNVYVSPTCQGDSTILIDSSMNIAPGSSRGWDFTGDAVPDIYTGNDFDTITWLFADAGVNIVTYIVKQIAGCNDFVNIDVPITPRPVLDITTKGAYCDTTDGWANVSVTNLPGPFRYFWSDGQTDSTATGLAIGTYTIAVTDETGCTTTEDVEIGEAIEVIVTQLKPSTCGIPDGIAFVSATGGYPPYTYVWSNGETTDTNKILSPGSHYVNVIDSKGCYAQGSINLASDGGPQVSLVDVTNNDCYGDRSGSIDISVSGGIAPYSILWSNGMTTQNIDSLAAGIYNVKVKDADGCLGAGSFQVLQPSQITISPVVTAATCEGSDGSAVAVVSGGTKPYTYQWSSGGIYRIEKGLAAGVYSVTVIDGKGCKMVEPVFVNNINAPEVTITDVQGIGCTVTDNGSISISVSPPNPFYDYNWSNGMTDPNISGLTAGTYIVTVTDEAGCKGVNQAVIRQEPPDVNPICLVTVDTATDMNMVVWEKNVTEDVSHYNIYRESSVKSDYQLIASVDVKNLSLFVDSVADPSVRSWRYKISVVDLCGNESELSPHHKTMHLTMNVGLVSNTVNLIWDHYEGFDVPTYTVYRAVTTAPVQILSEMPANLTSYTDDISALDNNLYYYIEVLAPDDGCTATDFKAATLNATRSNRKTKMKSTGIGPESVIEMYNLSVYPNPSNGFFNLDMDLSVNENIQLKVFDITGKLLSVRKFLNQSYSLNTEIDLSLHPAGMYHIHVKTDNALIHRVLIKE